MKNWNDTLTVINSVFAITTTVCLIWSRFIHLKIDILDYRTDQYSCKLYVRIVNNSISPIVINSFELSDGTILGSVYLMPKLVRTESLGNFEFQSATYPINIGGRSGIQEYLEFRDFSSPASEPIQLTEGKTILLRIHTNRGSLDRNISLPPTSHYLHTQRHR